MKLKKLIALGLSTVMAVSMLAGCGNTAADNKEASASSGSEGKEQSSQQASASATSEGEESSSEAEAKEVVFPLEETMEFTAFVALKGNGVSAVDNDAWRTTLDRANITFEVTEVPSAEATEKGNLLMASGDYPDMLFKSGLDLDSLGMDGLLIPLEDLIREYAPNLSALLDERNAWNEIAASDGHIYGLPCIGPSGCLFGMPVWINKAWMDKVGLDEPKNMEELYQILKAFKEEDVNGNGDPDDEIPLSFNADVCLWAVMLSYMPDALVYPNYMAITEEEELVYYPLTDGFKDNCLAYLTKMYEEGILDPNCFTQTIEQQRAIGKASNIYGMFFTNGLGDFCPLEEHGMEYITLKPFEQDQLPMNAGIYKGGMGITDLCENPEVLIAWADQLYTEEGGRLAWMGIEDVNYKILEDGSYEWMNTEGSYNIAGTQITPSLQPDLRNHYNPNANPLSTRATDQLQNGLYKDYGTIMPTLKLTEEENDKASVIQTDINSYISTYVAQVVTGVQSLEDSWDDFQKTLKDMKAEELLTIYQAAYERATAE